MRLDSINKIVKLRYAPVNKPFTLLVEMNYSKKNLQSPVGGGSAGCVLAARLSEDAKVKVLLVEAGDQMGYFTKIPLTPTAAQLGPSDWSVRSTPQKYSSFGLWDRVI